jgi:hypothetical protein
VHATCPTLVCRLRPRLRLTRSAGSRRHFRRCFDELLQSRAPCRRACSAQNAGDEMALRRCTSSRKSSGDLSRRCHIASFPCRRTICKEGAALQLKSLQLTATMRAGLLNFGIPGVCPPTRCLALNQAASYNSAPQYPGCGTMPDRLQKACTTIAKIASSTLHGSC